MDVPVITSIRLSLIFATDSGHGFLRKGVQNLKRGKGFKLESLELSPACSE